MNKICPSECSSILNQGNAIILDIREQFEYDAVHINSLHIPMAQVAERVEELKKFDKVIVMCQSGKRAEALVNFLETEYGLVNLIQMDGGIIGWKEKVDATLKFD